MQALKKEEPSLAYAGICRGHLFSCEQYIVDDWLSSLSINIITFILNSIPVQMYGARHYHYSWNPPGSNLSISVLHRKSFRWLVSYFQSGNLGMIKHRTNIRKPISQYCTTLNAFWITCQLYPKWQFEYDQTRDKHCQTNFSISVLYEKNFR